MIENETDIIPFETDSGDDPNRKSHYINPLGNTHIDSRGDMTAQDIVDTARITGQEVVALCGYKWVPKYNPKNYPVCEHCARIAGDLILGG